MYQSSIFSNPHMASKVSRYCTGVLEASWLTALIITPLFFNVYSFRTFEGDKTIVLRSLVLIMLLAWGIKLIEEGISKSNEVNNLKSLLRHPLIIFVILLAVMYLTSTALSIDRTASFWGSYLRQQGTYTLLSYLAISAAILGNLRQKEQVNRLLLTVVIASFPISLYAVLQRFQIDPIQWNTDVAIRSTANLGNPLFLAAYLIMVFPITLSGLINSFRRLKAGNSRFLTSLITYFIILILQLSAILLSGSRGPLLGLLVGVFFVFFAFSLLWQKRFILNLTLVATGVVIILLILVNLPSSPLEQLIDFPGVERYGQILTQENINVKVRPLIWEGVIPLIQPHPDSDILAGEPALSYWVRSLIGYGPESFQLIYPRFTPRELSQIQNHAMVPDRAHNSTWDILISYGLGGLIIFTSFFLAIFYYGLRWLGLINTPKERNIFLSSCLGLGFLVSIGLVIWGDLSYIGLGIPMGIILGVIVYLVYIAYSKNEHRAYHQLDGYRATIIIGILAGIIAHYIEISFGFEFSVSQTYFWVYVGVLIVIGYLYPLVFDNTENKTQDFNENEPATTLTSKEIKRSNIRDGRFLQRFPNTIMISSLIMGLILSTIGIGFLSSSGNEVSWSQILLNSSISGSNDASPYVSGFTLILLLSWIIPPMLYVSETGEDENQTSRLIQYVFVLILSGFIAGLYIIWNTSTLSGATRILLIDIENILTYVTTVGNLVKNYFIYLLVILFLLGLFLPLNWPESRVNRSRILIILAPLGLATIFVISYQSNVRPIMGDIYFKQAQNYSQQGIYPAAINLYHRAIDHAPHEDYYYYSLGQTYLEYSQTKDDIAIRNNLILEAKLTLEKSRELNPYNPDYLVTLANLYSSWASDATDLSSRSSRASIAEQLYTHATQLNPFNARYINEWAVHRLINFYDPDHVLILIEQALEIDPTYDFTYFLLGQYYGHLANISEDPIQTIQMLNQAKENYQIALELTRSDDEITQYGYLLALARIYTRLEDLNAAINAYELAAETLPGAADRWQIEENIAKIYYLLGNFNAAITHAGLAVELAPEMEQASIQQLIDLILDQSPP
jgi:tetratricopeptide (TPR) repeat protein